MEYIEIRDKGTMALMIDKCPYIDLNKTFDCGQCFRFEPVSLFGNKYEYGGVAFSKYVVFAQNSSDEIIVYGTNAEEFNSVWANFLALDSSYEEINSHILKVASNEHMRRALEYSSGIRILRQDPWESLCSFIISQNNNIPRIKKIIRELSEKYGSVCYFENTPHYTFPTFDKLNSAGVDGLFALKTGFRAKYIFDATEKLKNGEVVLDNIFALDYGRAETELSKIKGIGKKVAACALLFGFNKTEAFPIDVWMKRSLDNHFGGEIDTESLGKCAGIAQQYLFYYERYFND